MTNWASGRDNRMNRNIQMNLPPLTEKQAYVPVKSKLQHPPGEPPGHLNFWKIFVQIPPHRAEKLFKCPHPRENYQITVLTFQ